MEDRRRMIWLLLLALFQPSHTGAACNVTSKWEYYEHQARYYYYVQCALTSLQMSVPLTTYLSGYDYEVNYLRSIDFSSSTINTVPAGVFQAFSALKLLLMDNVSINNIEPGALRGLTQLEELYLSHNNISEIQDGTFDGLYQLKKLYMAGNKITTLNSLKGLASLQWLDVGRNNIATIDDGAFKVTGSLKNLNLNENKLVKLNADVFEELRHLVTLTMNNNRITSIPIGTFRHLGKVTTLDISFNNLTHLEYGFFSGLTSLEKLDVSDNNIAMLESKVLFPLASLTYLNLDGNLLPTFDVDTMVSHLGSLQYISLDRNQIRCDLLTSYLHTFRLRSIKIVSGDSYKTKNVHGIRCISDDAPRYSPIPSDISLNATRPLLPTTKSTGKSGTPAAVVPTKVTSSTTTRIPSTTVFSFTSVNPELVDVSTGHLVHTQTKEDYNDHAVVDSNIAEASRTENEKINEILKNTHCLLYNIAEASRAQDEKLYSLLVFTTVAVIILIIINMLINLYFTKRNNIENGRNSTSSCAVELLNVSD